MTASQLPAPLQPTPKAASTAKSSRLLALADGTPTTSRASSRARESRSTRHGSGNNNDFTSDRATIALIRRVLIPEDSHDADSRAPPPPIEQILPPLTSSNDIDVQLYAILAIIFKDFVNTWYSKITPDHTFVDEVIQIIAHTSRAIEQRLRQIDVVELCLNEIPILAERHVQVYRTAKSSEAALPYGNRARQTYHTLNPHPALNPSLPSDSQAQSEKVYRQLLIQGVLAALLPTEDLQNACLRILVTDIVADLILGRSLGDKVCEPWFLYDAFSKVVAILKAKMNPKATGREIRADTRGRLQQYGLLSTRHNAMKHYSSEHHQSLLSAWFWRALQYTYLVYLALRFLMNGVIGAKALPSRITEQTTRDSSSKTTVSTAAKMIAMPNKSNQTASGILTHKVFALFSALFMLPYRMPWLISSGNFWQYILVSRFSNLGGCDSRLDKFLHHSLETHVFSPSLLPSLLLNIRATIFPGNTVGPPAPPPPSTEEALQIRRRAATDILSLFPSLVATILFATSDHEEQIKQVDQDVLEVFSDTNMNKHLIYGILELILVRLVPEMVGQTPGELLAERGVRIDYGEKEIL